MREANIWVCLCAAQGAHIQPEQSSVGPAFRHKSLFCVVSEWRSQFCILHVSFCQD